MSAPGRPARPTPEQGRRRRLTVTLAALALAVSVAAVLGDRRNDDELRATETTTAGTPPPASGAGATTSAPSSPTVVPDPSSITVLVNKVWRLPPGWEPSDLVVPAVAFTFDEDVPKRRLRAPAAVALEGLFAAAEQAGVPLAVVSGYRSESTQAELFDQSVEEDGEAGAARTQARPGHSEHQTGLAVDVTTVDGACPAEACFAATPAAAWLAANAAEHGFVVRYPAGRESTTGYAFEPWHLRYVGVEVAARLVEEHLVLEELPAS